MRRQRMKETEDSIHRDPEKRESEGEEGLEGETQSLR